MKVTAEEMEGQRARSGKIGGEHIKRRNQKQKVQGTSY